MKKVILIVLGLFAVALFVVSLNGKITGNAFAYNLQRSCTENDGGNNPNVQGTTDFKDLASVKSKSTVDTCVNAAYLLEHYCDGPVHLTETISCRCENGACKK